MMGCYWVHTYYVLAQPTGAQMPHAADWPMPPTAAVSAIIKRASIFSLPQGNASDDGLHLSTYIRCVCTPYGDSPSTYTYGVYREQSTIYIYVGQHREARIEASVCTTAVQCQVWCHCVMTGMYLDSLHMIKVHATLLTRALISGQPPAATRPAYLLCT